MEKFWQFLCRVFGHRWVRGGLISYGQEDTYHWTCKRCGEDDTGTTRSHG